MKFWYEEILNKLLVNQKNLTNTERVKLFVTAFNYIFTKSKSKPKSIQAVFILNKLKKLDSLDLYDNFLNPYKYQSFLHK